MWWIPSSRIDRSLIGFYLGQLGTCPEHSRFAVRQARADMARLYAATGDAIARLDESGSEWTATLSLAGSHAQCLAPDPADADTVFAGLREGGVRKTTDGGQTWDDCALPQPGVFSLAVSAVDGAVYAGTEPSALYRSDDGGETWQELESLLELPSQPNWRTRTCGTSRRARGRTPPTAAATPRPRSTADTETSPGKRSRVGSRSRSRRCRTRWWLRTAACSRASQTARSGRPMTAATPGTRSRSPGTRSPSSTPSLTSARSGAAGAGLDPLLDGRCCALLDLRRQRVRRRRLPDEVALRERAALFAERVPDLLRLDAFGHDREPEVAAEVDRRADDRRVARVVAHVHDERAVDLDRLHGQPLQVGERRVAGAEVVDREPQAHLVQPREHAAHAERVGEDRALRDLELELVGADPVLLQQLCDPVRQLEVEQVGNRQVDGDV